GLLRRAQGPVPAVARRPGDPRREGQAVARAVALQAAEGGRRLREAREEVLAGSWLEEHRRQVHREEGSGRARVRQGGVLEREERYAPRAGEHAAVRLVPGQAPLRVQDD